MRIIEPGLDFTPPTWRSRCCTCKTLFEYTQDDIQGDFRDGNYVRCPNCNGAINHSLGHRVDPIGRAQEDVVATYWDK